MQQAQLSNLTRTQPVPIYSGTKTHRLTLVHTRIKPIQYQSSTALMHIYGKGERTHSTEYQLRLWANRFIQLPVWKMNETENNSTQTKCQTHFRIKSEAVKLDFRPKASSEDVGTTIKRLNLILKRRFLSAMETLNSPSSVNVILLQSSNRARNISCQLG